MSDRTQLNISDTVSTTNRSRTYTPAVSGDKKSGKNANIAIIVAPNSGIAVLRPTFERLRERNPPPFMSFNIPSTMTIALSTNIPIAKINEPSDTRCSVPPNILRKSSDPNTVTNSVTPNSTPLRIPIANINTTTTIKIDSSKLIKKLSIATLTLSG